MPEGPSRSWGRTAVCVALLVVLSVSIFSYTVMLRRPWFGTPGTLNSPNYITNALIFAKQWCRTGPWELGWTLCQAPRSIESSELKDLEIYRSYPPGLAVPIYALAKLSGGEPTLEMVQTYDLALHLLIAVMLGLAVLAYLRKTGTDLVSAMCLGAVPIILYLLLPAPLFQHQMRFVPDVAVMPYFVGFIFLEVLRDSVQGQGSRRALGVVQAAVGFLGALTDYFFVPIALCVYAKRLIGREMGPGFKGFVLKSVFYWLPMACAGGLFVLQLALVIGFEDVLYKFGAWTDIEPGIPISLKTFWQLHVVMGYGKFAPLLLKGGLVVLVAGGAVAAVRRYRDAPPNPRLTQGVGLGAMLLVPCMMHANLLKAHHAFPAHYFGALKFAAPMAAIPFALAPVLVLASLKRGAHREVQRAVAATCLVLACAYALSVHGQVEPQFTRDKDDPQVLAAARFIGEHTRFEDVVFTWAPELNMPKGYWAFTMKRIHRGPSIQFMYATVFTIEEDYVIALVTPHDRQRLGNYVDRLIPLAFETIDEDGFTMFKVRKADFLKLCDEVGVVKPPRPPENAKPRRWKGEKNLIRKLIQSGVAP